MTSPGLDAAQVVKHRQLSAEFPRRLREARKAAGLTAEQLAKVVGFMSKQSISSLERAKQGATLELAENLARALGVSVVWLAFGHKCDQGQ